MKQYVTQSLTLSSLSNAVVECADNLKADFRINDDYTINVTDSSVSVIIKKAGYMHAMLWQTPAEVALAEFNQISSATYEELMAVEPLLNGAKLLLIQLHKEFVDAVDNRTATRYSVQDVQRILEGEGKGPSLG